MNWDDVFTAIEAAITNAANQRSAEIAVLEAERHGLAKQSNATGAYEDKFWEKTADGMILRLKWHCYDPSQAFSVRPDMNVLTLELRQDDQILRRAESRFEDRI
jgi:hypothetical protein